MEQYGSTGGDPSGVPRSPTGRLPQWVVDEAVGIPSGPDPWRAPPTPPRRRRGRGVVRTVLVVVLVLFFGIGAAVLVGPGPWSWGPPTTAELQGAPPEASAVPVPTDRPAPGNEVADLPLGTPPPPPAEGGVHTFATFQSDGVTPVAYDPCRPVHYVVRPDAAPPGGEALVH